MQIKKNRIQFILILTVLCCQIFLYGCGNKREVIELEEIVPATEESVVADEDIESDSDNTFEEEMIYVYVCGAVTREGVYKLCEGSRVYEAIELAGGFLEDAVTSAINQARVLEDGEQLWIPTEREWEEGRETKAIDGGRKLSSDGKVDLNQASVQELTTLSGIGESKAAAIIAYREEHGKFQNTEELMNISGIGEHTYAKIKEQVSVR